MKDIRVVMMKELHNKNMHDIIAYFKRKGALNAGHHYTLFPDGTLKQHLKVDEDADVMFKDYDSKIIVVCPNKQLTKVQKNIIEDMQKWVLMPAF